MINRHRWLAVIVVAATLAIGSVATSFWRNAGEVVPQATNKLVVVRRLAHNQNSFVQGLACYEGRLWESSGRYGQSHVWESGLDEYEPVRRYSLNQEYFGEGITILDGKLYQLTWKRGVCVVFDLKTRQFLKSFSYAGEGWGIANDGKQLYQSDGSSRIRIRSPQTFRVERSFVVRDEKRVVNGLNELEFVRGELWANIWHSDLIARIDHQTGDVVGWVDGSNLWPLPQRTDKEHVFNGIAYDPIGDRLFVTGKCWPNLFEVKLAE